MSSAVYVIMSDTHF